MLPRASAARAAARSALDLTALGRGVERGVELAAEAAEIPGRLLRLLDEIEQMLGRVGPLIDRMEDLTERAAGVLDAAGETVGGAAALNAEASATIFDAGEVANAVRTVIDRATGVTDRAALTVRSAEAMLGQVEPLLARVTPMAEKFVAELSEEEIHAAIHLVDELPRLVDHLRDDILPILATLERAGPDLSELVKVSYDVRRAILGIPGFSFFRRRGEEALSDVEDADLIAEDPPEDDRPAVPQPLPPEGPGTAVSSRFTDAGPPVAPVEPPNGAPVRPEKKAKKAKGAKD